MTQPLQSLVPVPVYVGIGSNIVPDESLIIAALRIQEYYPGVEASKVYRSPSYGPPGQPDFLHCIIRFHTAKTHLQIREQLRAIEQELENIHPDNAISNRPVDLDLLLHGTTVETGEGWTLPHHHVRQQLFIIEPLLELDPTLVDPYDKKPLLQLREEMRNLPQPSTHELLSVEIRNFLAENQSQ